ncbi:transcription repressor NadR [Virgibacillus profundi]|uniref:Transcription repressor NadR n=1 Tax=Virgibacillus profundi TaxID=2024555 RepID=A0A2A2IA47_9BACI|nr:transcription repressor NadR [Virgibacillus profundi]PXY53049.1 transcription repressor NadR [Virgibacillus profundi]
MNDKSKMSSTDRQKLIMDMLNQAEHPITGSDFANKTNVSRQVIVQDVSILKAKNEPIIATSQGYLLINQQMNEDLQRMVIVCNHTPEQTKKELYSIVDHGVTVKDVIVEHAIYGDLTASIMVSSRVEVDQFIKKINETNASYLSTLTEGIHLHTLEANTMDKIEAACKTLEEVGILIR